MNDFIKHAVEEVFYLTIDRKQQTPYRVNSELFLNGYYPEMSNRVPEEIMVTMHSFFNNMFIFFDRDSDVLEDAYGFDHCVLGVCYRAAMYIENDDAPDYNWNPVSFRSFKDAVCAILKEASAHGYTITPEWMLYVEEASTDE